LVPPITSGTGEVHSHVHSQGPSEQKHIKNFGKKGAWVNPGTDQIFWVMDFKFGRYILHSQGPSEQKPIKNFGKK